MALSDDLRKRVVEAVVLGGLSRNAAARRFGVSIASAVRWVTRYKTTGQISPSPSGGDRRSGRIEAQRDYLLGLIRRTPDITLLEIQSPDPKLRRALFGFRLILRTPLRDERVGSGFEGCVRWTQRRLRLGLAGLGFWIRRNAQRRSGNWRWPKRTIRSTLRLTLSMLRCCLMRLLLRPRLRKTCCRRSGGVGLRALAVRT